MSDGEGEERGRSVWPGEREYGEGRECFGSEVGVGRSAGKMKSVRSEVRSLVED